LGSKKGCEIPMPRQRLSLQVSKATNMLHFLLLLNFPVMAWFCLYPHIITFSMLKYSTFIGVIFSILSFLKEKKVGFWDHLAACVSPIATLNQLTYFHRTWYKHMTLEATSYFFNLLQMVVTTWWVCELVRWHQH
jgi:hypothetical protein